MSTGAQRAEVRRLATSGVSVRAIAAEVFGDVRFRGRVERILRSPADSAESPEAVAAREEELRFFEGLGGTAQLRWLHQRMTRSLAQRDDPPSPGDLRALIDSDRRLRALEQLERLAPHRPEIPDD